MKFGLTEDQLKSISDYVASHLIERGAVVYCFGSRARRDFRPFSDFVDADRVNSEKENVFWQ